MNERPEFDPRLVSPSRIGTYADCGVQFRFKYIDRIDPGKMGSSALFGKVMHNARALWVLDRSQDLTILVRRGWKQETNDDPAVQRFLMRYAVLSSEAREFENSIREEWAAQGKESKKPRSTTLWKESEIAQKIEALVKDSAEELEEKSLWRFDENYSLPYIFDQSLALAEKYEQTYKKFPNSYYSEIPFDFDWSGFRLNGYIDEIAPVYIRGQGLRAVGVIDAKTYSQIPVHRAKDWRQLIIYSIAYAHLRDTGFIKTPDLPLVQGVDQMRHLTYVWYQMGQREQDRLKFELDAYARAVDNKIFIPAAKTCNARFCDFSGHCIYYHGNASREIDLATAFAA